MLRSMNELDGYAVNATDGAIGTVKDFYFDDEAWAIRYLIVETGSWLASRKVLISPISIGRLSPEAKVLPVSITLEQVKNSPNIDTDKPVSRQHEREYLGYYNYPVYWGGAGLWGGGAYPGMVSGLGFDAGSSEYRRALSPDASAEPADARGEVHDTHLRSCKAIMTYGIEAIDGDLGHVHGLLLDEETWAVRYLIVNTSNWWLGHKALIAPQWIQDMRWSDKKVKLNLTRKAIKDAPQYDPSITINRDREALLYQHYDRPGYWTGEGRAPQRDSGAAEPLPRLVPTVRQMPGTVPGDERRDG
jgi:uncharacterized protein YrrD